MMKGLQQHFEDLADALGVKLPRAQAGVLVNGVHVVEISDDGTTQVMAGFYKAGQLYPDHRHEESYELLWCVTGSFAIHQPSKDDVVLYPTQSICLPPMQSHSVACQEDGELMAILRPPERVYQFKETEIKP